MARNGHTNKATYALKATSSPIVMVPWTTMWPPTPSTMMSPTAGS